MKSLTLNFPRCQFSDTAGRSFPSSKPSTLMRISLYSLARGYPTFQRFPRFLRRLSPLLGRAQASLSQGETVLHTRAKNSIPRHILPYRTHDSPLRNSRDGPLLASGGPFTLGRRLLDFLSRLSPTLAGFAPVLARLTPILARLIPILAGLTPVLMRLREQLWGA